MLDLWRQFRLLEVCGCILWMSKSDLGRLMCHFGFHLQGDVDTDMCYFAKCSCALYRRRLAATHRRPLFGLGFEIWGRISKLISVFGSGIGGRNSRT